jgi:membrane-associated phospholipid phosphatase
VHTLRHLDDRVLRGINTFARHTPWLHGVLLAWAAYGVVVFVAVLLVGVLLARRAASERLAAASWAGIGVLVAVALNQPLGRLVGEGRPYAQLRGLLVLATRTSDFSFPSDHAVMAGAVTAGAFLVSRRLGAVALALALLMAFARVYIAAHYPWDVVAGLGFGAAVVLVGWAVLRRPLTMLTDWLRRQPGPRRVFAEPDPGRP